MGCVATCIGLEDESDETKTMLLPSDMRLNARNEDEFSALNMFPSIDSKSYRFVYWFCVDASSLSFPHEVVSTIYDYYNTELQDMAILIQPSTSKHDQQQKLLFNIVARSDWQPQSKQSDAIFADSVNENKCKILLLGAGHTGKSTIFKQLRCLYGCHWSQLELWCMKPIITQNLIESMKVLAKHSKVKASNESIRQKVCDMEDKQRYTHSQHEYFKTLLADDGIQDTVKQRGKLGLQLPDSFPYLLRNMHQYHREQYVPTAVDLIHSYQRTSGANIAHIINSQGGMPRAYDIVDVGGLKLERRKWRHFYDATNVVMNVIDLSGFCTQQAEGGNRLAEDMEVFKGIVNLEVFQQCEWMVILNKYDVFEEYVNAGMKFAQYFTGYRGDNQNCLQIIEFVVMQLLAEMRDERRRGRFSFFVTTALNTGSIQSVFEYLHCNLLQNAK